MAVRRGASMTRNVFDDRKNTAIEKSLHGGAAKLDHGPRFGRIGPVSDDVMRSRKWDIGNRRTIHIHADRFQIVSDEPRRQIGRGTALIGVAFEYLADASCGRA